MWNIANWKQWRLVLKLDPAKNISAYALKLIAEKEPDAVIIGGTLGVNLTNTRQLISDIRYYGYGGDIVQEISNSKAIANNVDAYLIPIVLNAGDYKWITGLQHESIKTYKDIINWNKVLAEGYVVCNPESAVGKLTGVLPVDDEDAASYAILAEKLLGLSVLYIEYSGIFGDPILVEKVTKERRHLHIIYGGGIFNSCQAEIMLELVDTIVIGNVIYEKPEKLIEIFNIVK